MHENLPSAYKLFVRPVVHMGVYVNYAKRQPMKDEVGSVGVMNDPQRAKVLSMKSEISERDLASRPT